VRTQGPHGPIDVPAPPNSKAGDTFQCCLKPPAELKVVVPPGFTGSTMIFEVDDGSKIAVVVPKGKQPGDVLHVRPPAVLVRVPDGVNAGEYVNFSVRGGHGDGSKVEWFRAKVPKDLQLGYYFAARIPQPEHVSSGLEAIIAHYFSDVKSGQHQGLAEKLPIPETVVCAERYEPDSMPKNHAHTAIEIDINVELTQDPSDGELVRTQGPHGPIDVPAPPNSKAGQTFQCRLKPPAELKVTVPPGFTGSSMIFEVDGGSKIAVSVPSGKKPGDVLYVRPPALLVRVPEGVKTGEFVAFTVRGGDGDKSKAEWFRARVPKALQFGYYFTARLPHVDHVSEDDDADEMSSTVSDLLNERDVELES